MGIDDESSHPELCSEVADGVTRNTVSLFREPDAVTPPVRFDEREQETEPSQTGLRRPSESPAHKPRSCKSNCVNDHRKRRIRNRWLSTRPSLINCWPITRSRKTSSARTAC